VTDLTEGNEGKLIWHFAIPMLIGNVFQQLYNVADSIVVGQLLPNGKEALAAVGASFPVLFTIASLIIGVSSGTTIIIAQYFGAKDFTKIKKAVDTMFIMLFFSSILAGGLGVYFSETIFRYIELPEELIPDAVLYFNINMIGIVTMFGFNGISGVLRGFGDSKTPLYFLILSTILNIILDLVFVLAFGWGIAGVAWATVIAQGFSFVIGVWYLNRTHKLISISIFKLEFDWDIFAKSIKIGLPSGLQHMFVAMGMVALFRIVNSFGTNVIAAYSVAGRIDSFAIMPAMNFAMALTTFTGQNLGANKPHRVINGLKATLFMTAIISVSFSLAAILFGKQLMHMFTADPEVILIGAEYLVIVGVFYVVFSTMFSINAVFRGAGDTIVPMFITLFSLWAIRVPLSWYLSQHFGYHGIWWGIPLAWVIGTIFSFFYLLSGKWKTKAIIKFPEIDK